MLRTKVVLRLSNRRSKELYNNDERKLYQDFII